MANSTVGQLAPFIGKISAGGNKLPLRTSGSGWNNGLWGARLAFSALGASGSTSISGTTKSGGVAAARRVVLMTQPPRAKIVYEKTTTAAVNSFLFPNLPSGTYTVIDFAPDSSRQALIYDWVVAG